MKTEIEHDWASWMWKDWQVIAFERVSPSNVISVQAYPPGKICFFAGEKLPEHKKRPWEREIEQDAA